MTFVHICDHCLLRLSLGPTRYGWLGCVVCQGNVDRYIEEFLANKFPEGKEHESLRDA